MESRASFLLKKTKQRRGIGGGGGTLGTWEEDNWKTKLALAVEVSGGFGAGLEQRNFIVAAALSNMSGYKLEGKS